MRRHARKQSRPYLWGFGLALLVVFGACFGLLYLALSPTQSAKAQLESWATYYAKLDEVEDFTVFAGQQAYYSIEGRDANQQRIRLVWTPGEDQPELVAMADGIDRAALAKIAQKEGLSLNKVAFGRYDDRWVWEITSQNRYYVVDFETGKILRVAG